MAVAPENPIVEVREQAVEGGEVELSCLVPRSRPAALLRWYRDRKELKGTTWRWGWEWAGEGRDLRDRVPGGVAWERLVYIWMGLEEECMGLADTTAQYIGLPWWLSR